jgi:hypothetical protein
MAQVMSPDILDDQGDVVLDELIVPPRRRAPERSGNDREGPPGYRDAGSSQGGPPKVFYCWMLVAREGLPIRAESFGEMFQVLRTFQMFLHLCQMKR